jgi:hypothetical protein
MKVEQPMSYPQMKVKKESYPVLRDTKKSELRTGSAIGQVIEKKEENAVFHRSWLCLPTTTNLN